MNYIIFLPILTFFILIKSQEYLQPPKWWNDRVEQGNLLSISNGVQEPDSYLMTSVGNGYVSYVIGSDSIYVGGVFNGPDAANAGTSSPSHRASIPNFQNITILGTIFQYSGLDIENATYTRIFSYGSTTTIKQLYYAHQKFRNILAQEIEIDNSINDQDIELELSTIGLNIESNPDFLIVNLTRSEYIGDSYQLYNLTIKVPEINFQTSVSVVTTSVPNSIKVKKGETVKHHFITSFLTNIETENYIQDCIEIYKASYLLSDFLMDSHLEGWSKLWSLGIEIGGDFHLKQVVNSSLYYILSSIRDDWSYGISPGGLASNGYNGHVFWDQETWMYPVFALLNPTLAKNSMLQYRVNNLENAHEKALSYIGKNYTGYMFPWESAFTGIECCPNSAPTGQLEQHISGDIAMAFKFYYQLTNDYEWLVDYGYKTVKGIAEFWASRVVYDEQTLQYSINTIIPPDEYAVGVNNSVYTNVVVKMTFEWVIEIATLLNDTDNIPLDYWQSISDGLVILFDQDLQWHPEYMGYSGETIKQADVVLLGFPLMYNMSKQVRENDLIYYQEKTNPSGPAMTYSMHTIAWLELGNLTKAEEQWQRAYANCNNSPFLVWTETPTGGTTNFLTGIGGFLQGVVFGYGGLRVNPSSLDFYPQLPTNTTSIKIRSINYIGSIFNLTWNETVIELQMLSINPSSSLSLLDTSNDDQFILNSIDPIYLPIGSKFKIFSSTTTYI